MNLFRSLHYETYQRRSVAERHVPLSAGPLGRNSRKEIAMRSFFILSLLVIPLLLMGKDDIPQSIKIVLDKQFPGWKIRPNHFPNPCDSLGMDTTSFEPLSECDLNGDDIPDYVIGIITGNDSNLVEYIVAAVSADRDYKVFTLSRSAAFHGAGELYYLIIEAGKGTALFSGDEDTVINNLAKQLPNSTDVAFPTDAILICPKCEDIWKECQIIGFVYTNNRFYSFSAGD
jgi:hypothetical protein